MERLKFPFVIQKGWTSVLEYLPKKYARVRGHFETRPQVLKQQGQYKGELLGYKERKEITVLYYWNGSKWVKTERRTIKL